MWRTRVYNGGVAELASKSPEEYIGVVPAALLAPDDAAARSPVLLLEIDVGDVRFNINAINCLRAALRSCPYTLACHLLVGTSRPRLAVTFRVGPDVVRVGPGAAEAETTVDTDAVRRPLHESATEAIQAFDAKRQACYRSLIANDHARGIKWFTENLVDREDVPLAERIGSIVAAFGITPATQRIGIKARTIIDIRRTTAVGGHGYEIVSERHSVLDLDVLDVLNLEELAHGKRWDFTVTTGGGGRVALSYSPKV